MMLLRALAVGLLLLVVSAPPLLAQKPTQQEAFTPIGELPPEEQLAAAPLLIGAYVFVLAVLFGYLVTVSRRLGAIERDIHRLASDLKPAGRG
jgi:hypothetical protein